MDKQTILNKGFVEKEYPGDGVYFVREFTDPEEIRKVAIIVGVNEAFIEDIEKFAVDIKSDFSLFQICDSDLLYVCALQQDEIEAILNTL